VTIQTTFHPEGAQPNGINTIAEIPGTDLAHEVVIMGAHMDGVPYATGATDNATGSAAMMEAVRAIQALKLRPRRTIRVALWGGEEQGLLGSRAYVAEHFWDASTEKPKPAHANVAAYFNLDNGTGRIRGIWGQANKGALPILEKWGEPLDGPLVVRPGGSTRLPVHPGAPGIQLAVAPLEHGHVRPCAARRRRAAGRRGRRVRVAGRELARETAEKAPSSPMKRRDVAAVWPWGTGASPAPQTIVAP
jgi:hypothetical protein